MMMNAWRKSKMIQMMTATTTTIKVPGKPGTDKTI